MYSKDKLTHPQMPPLDTSEFNQLRKDILIPDVRDLNYKEFKNQIESHFRKTSVNHLKGFEAFTSHDIILGCQHYIDNLISKNGIGGIQIFEHDYGYYKKVCPDITYTTLENLVAGKPLLMAMPFPGHLGIHRQMKEILEICTDKCIDVHLDGSWLTSAFDIEFDFDQTCIKSFAMSFSKAYNLHWNKIGLRWSRVCDPTDSITILNRSEAIAKTNLYVANRYMQEFGIDHLVVKYKTQYLDICKELKLRPSNIIHACFSMDRKFLYGMKNFFN
jgi:hypothetical protein